MKRILRNNYPKISIVTCVFNGEKYISKLLESVLNMGYPNIEHIIVNDGSTDSTEAIVMKYAVLYKKKENSNFCIKYIKQENKGLGEATNTGLRQITGDYWTWINCDDWYEPDAFYEPMDILLANDKVDYVFLNGYEQFVYNGITQLIISENSKQAFENRKKLLLQRVAMSDWKYTHFICKTTSYRKINPTMMIYPSRATNDIQFEFQMFGLLVGKVSKKPCWTYLRREDSLFRTLTSEQWGKVETIIERSVDLLNVKQKMKDTLIALYYETDYLNKIKNLAYDHNKKDFKKIYGLMMANRKRMLLSYRLYTDHKLLLYYFYCIFSFIPDKRRKGGKHE